MSSIAMLENSPAFRRWCDALREVSGIDVYLLGGPSLDKSLKRTLKSISLCRLLGSQCARCTSCRKRFAKRLGSVGAHHSGPYAMRCFVGMTVTALPFTLGDGTTAFLYTQPTLLTPKGKTEALNELLDRVARSEDSLSQQELATIVRQVPVRGLPAFNATITLLRVIARQLSHVSRQMLNTHEAEGHNDWVVRRGCEIIEDQFTEALHIGDVAQEIGVSQSYLSHLFSRQMGLSFTSYLIERRVIEMKRLLTDSDLTITEVLFASGFQSVSQGNRSFRAVAGMAPRAFRAMGLDRNSP